jgi:hypothetical protein
VVERAAVPLGSRPDPRAGIPLHAARMGLDLDQEDATGGHDEEVDLVGVPSSPRNMKFAHARNGSRSGKRCTFERQRRLGSGRRILRYGASFLDAPGSPRTRQNISFRRAAPLRAGHSRPALWG